MVFLKVISLVHVCLLNITKRITIVIASSGRHVCIVSFFLESPLKYVQVQVPIHCDLLPRSGWVAGIVHQSVDDAARELWPPHSEWPVLANQ